MSDFIVPEPSQGAAGCQNCGKPEIEPGYALPLCRECRERLADRGLPRRVWAFFAVVLIIFVAGLVELPGSLRAGIAFRRGERAYRAGLYAQAVPQLQIATRRFSGSVKARVYLAVALHKIGRTEESEKVQDSLTGAEVPKDLEADVQSLPGVTVQPVRSR